MHTEPLSFFEQTFLAGYTSMGLIVTFAWVVLGNYRLGLERQDELTTDAKQFRWRAFVLEQAIMMALHPKNIMMGIFGAYFFWPFLAACFLFEIAVSEGIFQVWRFFDFRDFVATEATRQERENYRQRYNMEFSYHHQSSADYMRKIGRLAVARELAKVAVVQMYGELSARAAAAFMFVAGLLSAPLGKAKAADNEDDLEGGDTTEMAEKPFEPVPPAIHGVILSRTQIALGDGDDARWRVAMARLNVSGKPAPELSYFALFAFDQIAAGNDPIIMANGTWTPNEHLAVTAGRLATPVGLSRQPGPHQKIELTYPATGETAPLFDDGVLATLRPLDRLALDLGLVTGYGAAFEADSAPDAVGRITVTLNDKLTVSVDGQVGQIDSGWRHETSASVEFNLDKLSLQAEAVQTTTPAEADTMIALGWWTLVCWRPVPSVDLYTRVESFDRDLYAPSPFAPTITSGVNVRPKDHLSLRGAVAIPFAQDGDITIHLAAQVTF